MMNLDQLNRWFRPWSRRIMGMVRRFTVAGSNDSFGLMRLQIETLKDVTQDNVEHVQNYGFTSRPKNGAEGLVVYVGGNQDHGVVIAVDDVRYRIKALEEGEVAIYTDEGDKIHFKRGNEIEITTQKLTVNAAASVTVNTTDATVTASGDVDVTANKATITAPLVEIVAATMVNMTTPLLAVSGLVSCAGLGAGAGVTPVSGKAKVQGDLEITGTTKSVGNIESQANVKDSVGTMAQIRTTYNSHTHQGVTSGPNNSGTTNQPM